MVLQEPWVSQKLHRISCVSRSRFFNGYVRLALSIFSQSCLVCFFARLTKELMSRFVCLSSERLRV